MPKKNETGMPDHLKESIENLSGYSMDDVRVHYNSDKPATVQALDTRKARTSTWHRVRNGTCRTRHGMWHSRCRDVWSRPPKWAECPWTTMKTWNARLTWWEQGQTAFDCQKLATEEGQRYVSMSNGSTKRCPAPSSSISEKDARLTAPRERTSSCRQLDSILFAQTFSLCVSKKVCYFIFSDNNRAFHTIMDL